MAETGLVPFASTYSVFAARRAYDFICLDIAEPRLNVNIVGGLPGLTTGYGPSHQATADVAIFRAVPGLTIVDPCDSVDITQAVPQLAAHDGPTYLRLLRGQVPTVLDAYDYTFELGKAKVLRDGTDVVFQRPDDDARPAGCRGTVRAQCRRRGGAHPDVEAVRRGHRFGPDRFGPTRADAGESHRRRRAVRNRGIRGAPARHAPAGHADRPALPTLHDRYGLSTARIVASVPCPTSFCHLSGNETLMHSWSSLEGSIRMSIMFAGVDRALKNMDAKRHLEIVDAIESGDADKAAVTVREHMAGAATVLVGGAA